MKKAKTPFFPTVEGSGTAIESKAPLQGSRSLRLVRISRVSFIIKDEFLTIFLVKIPGHISNRMLQALKPLRA